MNYHMAVEGVGKDVVIIKDKKIIARGRTVSARGDDHVSVKIHPNDRDQFFGDKIDQETKEILACIGHIRVSPITGMFLTLTLDFEERAEELEEPFEHCLTVDQFNLKYGLVPDHFKDCEDYRSSFGGNDVCQGYTVEGVLTNSSMSKMLAKQGRKIKGVLTAQEMQEEVNAGKTIQAVKWVIDEKEYFFFTDDYCIGVNYFPKMFVPCSTVIPHDVKPRESLPDGVVKDVSDYLKIYERNSIQITSVEELVEYLNKTFTDPIKAREEHISK